MSQTSTPQLYNPSNLSSKELIDNFVVRTKMFNEIFNDIKNSEMKYPEQHYIIQGVRGQGKTTFLLRLYYGIKKDPTIMKRFVPIIFNEEQYNIRSLYRLWENVADYLEEYEMFDGIYDKMVENENEFDYEIKCFNLLVKFLKKEKKKLILFVDNIGILLSKFSEKESHRLREVLIECAEIRIVGASSSTLEYNYDYKKPFFEFFAIKTLKGLKLKETKKLLLRLGELYGKENIKDIIENNPGKVEALRRMTGGVIRTIVLLFDIFTDETNGQAFNDLEKVLDQVTPLYKHRMDDLTPPQQEIVDVVAIAWDAVSAKEIANKVRLTSRNVSAQLKQLQKNQLIEQQQTATKNKLYRVSERFFNIWYLMRQGKRHGVDKVRFLVEFLENWCNKNELENRAEKQLNALNQGKMYPKHALYFTEALAKTDISYELQNNLIQKAEEYYLKAIEKGYDKALFNLASLYNNEFNDYKRAEEFYLKAVEKGDEEALGSLGLLYHSELKDYKKAEECFIKAIENGLNEGFNSLAWLYFIQNIKKEKALESAQKAYKHNKDSAVCHTYTMILLWHDDIEKAKKIFETFLNDREMVTKSYDDMSLFFIMLVAKKQYHLTLKIFNKNQFDLKERYKPIYYALMHFLKEEYPNEYIKMGSELKETVEEVIGEIVRLREKYK